MPLDNPHVDLDSHVLDPATVSNEVQSVDLTSLTAAKTWTLTFDGETTGNIAAKASATAAEVQAKLEGVSNVQPGDVTVTGETGGPFTVTFKGQYAGVNVPQMTGTGQEGTVTVTTVTQGGQATKAVRRGAAPLADATAVSNPLLGDSPNEQREDDAADYGDA